MYESPIELFTVEEYSKQIDEQIEKAVYEVITKVGINVNREELIKALEYDRNQYEKGYADGKKDGIEWHPYPEEIPNDTKQYLLFCNSESERSFCIGWYDRSRDGDLLWHEDGGYVIWDVIYWSELPNLTRKKQRNDTRRSNQETQRNQRRLLGR